MSSCIRLFVVDPHPMICRGVDSMTAETPDIELAGRAHHLEHAEVEIRGAQPDVVMIDPATNDARGLALIRSLGQARVSPRMLIFSASESATLIDEVIRLGVLGYVLKSEAVTAVVDAIRRIAHGLHYFSTAIQRRLVVDGQGLVLAERYRPRASLLTRREFEILRLIGGGRSVKEVAGSLGLSSKTVDNHKTRGMIKLGVHNRVELIHACIREQILPGLLPAPEPEPAVSRGDARDDGQSAAASGRVADGGVGGLRG